MGNMSLKTYIWFRTFRYNYTRVQLNSKGRRRASRNKTKSRQNRNRRRNNMIKSKQISSEVPCAGDCFTTWNVICIMYLFWNMFQWQT